jgi:tRNA pseudouridine38-40 synthase
MDNEPILAPSVAPLPENDGHSPSPSLVAGGLFDDDDKLPSPPPLADAECEKPSRFRYFIEMSYKGTRFHGWQMQGNAYTVQGELNRALAVVFRRNVPTYGCGRTDAGVHARQFFAQFDNPEPVEDVAALAKKLNYIMLPDVSIARIFEVPDTANTRFDAFERTYKYIISTHKNPFLQEFAWYYPYPLSIRRMNTAAKLLPQTTEFGAFAKANAETKTNICQLSYAHFEVKKSEGIIVFTITSNRFLRNMVRAVVGTLVDVGRGVLSVKGMQEVIDSQCRSNAGASAPAEGLYLWKIKYPYIDEAENQIHIFEKFC